MAAYKAAIDDGADVVLPLAEKIRRQVSLHDGARGPERILLVLELHPLDLERHGAEPDGLVWKKARLFRDLPLSDIGAV